MLLLVAASLVPCFFAVRTLQVSTRYVDLLPQEHAAVKNYFKAFEKFGGTDYMIVLIEAKDAEQARGLADEMASEMDETGRFKYIQYKADVTQFQRYGLLFLDKDTLNELDRLLAERNIDELAKMAQSFLALREELSQAFGGGITIDDQGYFTSDDGKSVLLVARPSFNADDSAKAGPLGREMNELAGDMEKQNPGVKVWQAGNYALQYEQRNVVNRDILVVGLIALLVIVVVLAVAFRGLTEPLLAIASLGVGVMWTLAFARVTVKSLNTVSSVFAAVLMGIGIEYGIALLARYREERDRGDDGRQAFVSALSNTGKGIITGALTTAGAFYAIVFSEFKAMHDMGLVLGTGVLCTLLATFFVLPALMTMKEKLIPYKAREGESSSRLMRREGSFIARRPWWIIGVGLVLTIGLGTSAGFIKYESNIRKVEPRGMEVTKAEEKLASEFGMGSDFVIVLSNNEPAMREVTEKLAELLSVRAVESLATIIPSEQLSKLVLMSRIQTKIQSINPDWLSYVPPEMLAVLDDIGSDTLTVDKLPADALQKYVSSDGTYATYVYPRKSMSEEKNVNEFLDQVRQVSTDVIGFPVIVQDLLESTRKGLNDTTLLSAVVVMLMVVIDFQAVLPSLLALLPLAFAMVWMIGAFNLLGMKFNIVNIAVTPMILGIGVDFGVYVLHRYEEEHLLEGETIPSVLAHTGKAILVSGLTVVAAFAALLLARYRGLASLGLAAALGIGSAVIIAVTLLPAILRVMEKKRKSGRAF
ncbi:MAG: MMPL family transporter [Actinomycetota bacterium]